VNRIKWDEMNSGSKSSVGHVGFVEIAGQRIRIASISWSFNRADTKPWVLRTEIPGWTNARHHKTATEAQDSCERILTSFLTALAAPMPTMSEIRHAAENAHESGYPDAAFGDFHHGFQCGARWMGVGR
jgi:hypothetical protein